MTTPTTRAAETTEAPQDLQTAPTTRKAARKALAAQQKLTTRATRKADKRAAAPIPNPYTVGDHVRYTDKEGISFPAGKIIAVTKRDVVIEFGSGIDFRLDQRDPGLNKARFS